MHCVHPNITSTAALIDPLLPEWFHSLSISDMGEFAVHGFKIYLFKGQSFQICPFCKDFHKKSFFLFV